ncbi:MAG: dUTP diphosphatase [Spirochaetes bacterium]|nr:dUTP diphosphatase [Spirochaetota bacterium]
MSTIQVKIRTVGGGRVPEYQSAGAAGADVFALLAEPLIIAPGAVALVPTGTFIELPENYEAQIRPRSGLALKHGITLLNTPGTIDSDYRGEVKIIMANFGKEPFTVESGMRIAQMVFALVYRGEFAVTAELAETERNHGGFGHTGI